MIDMCTIINQLVDIDLNILKIKFICISIQHGTRNRATKRAKFANYGKHATFDMIFLYDTNLALDIQNYPALDKGCIHIFRP